MIAIEPLATLGDLAVLLITGLVVFAALHFSLSDMWGPR